MNIRRSILQMLGIKTRRTCALVLIGSLALSLFVLVPWILSGPRSDDHMTDVVVIELIVRLIWLLVTGLLAYLTAWALVTEHGRITLAALEEERPKTRRMLWWLKALFATYGIAVGTFMIVMVVAFISNGHKGIEYTFDQMHMILGVLCLLAFPIVYKWLR